MCILLGGFLRSTLGLGEKQTISWGEELRLARSYLDIEQVRFGKRLQVDMTAAETCEECAVPPLLLQPLIENAVKHGIFSVSPVIPWFEDDEDWFAFRDSIFESLQPQGWLQLALADRAGLDQGLQTFPRA